jgi:DNA-binding protein HU-beta
MKEGKMIKSDIIARVMDELGYTRAQADKAVNTVLETVIEALSDGESVIIRKFGSFEVYDSKRRKGRNLKTGEEVPIPPQKVVRFKPSKKLKFVEE